MQQSQQEVQNYQEDEIDLKALVFSLIERKFLILGLTAFVTVLAYLYSTTIATVYQANSSFTSPTKSSVFNINTLITTNETNNSIFSSFLAILSSRDLQKEVFIENDFLTQFNKDNNPIDNVDNFIEGVIASIIVIRPQLNVEEEGFYLTEKPYSISINGGDAEAISNYLDALVNQADAKNIFEINKLNQQKISNRLDQIAIDSSILLKKSKQERLNQIDRIKEEDGQKIREINDQIDRARYKTKETRLNQIEVLIDAAKLAKSVGIIENNFKLIYGEGGNSDLTIAISENNDLPEWYLYGEKALLHRVELLQNRTSDDPFITELVTLNNQLNQIQNNNLLLTLKTRQDDSPFIPELVALNIEKDNLESTNLNLVGEKSINLVETAQVISIARDKNLIVLLGFFGGFMMSIFLALIMNALKPDEKANA
jgi:chain length determinant protein (polysaccharide antigen chain regulator)